MRYFIYEIPPCVGTEKNPKKPKDVRSKASVPIAVADFRTVRVNGFGSVTVPKRTAVFGSGVGSFRHRGSDLRFRVKFHERRRTGAKTFSTFNLFIIYCLPSVNVTNRNDVTVSV